MRNILLAGTALALSSFSSFGSAQAVTINANVPSSFTVNYNGNVEGQNVPGLTSTIDFTFLGTSSGGTTYNFSYDVTNTSSVSSRVSGFAFNVDPNVTGGSTTGAFGNINFNGNYPNGIGNVEVCFVNSQGNGCAGGASGGAVSGGPTVDGLFSLSFAQAYNQINLTDFYVRYQSIVGVTAGTSGTGTGMVVPGPIAGAGLPALLALGGFVWARRRKAAAVA